MEDKNLTSTPWERFMELERGREVQSNLYPYQQVRGTLQKEQRQCLASHPSAGALTSGVLLPEDTQRGHVPLQ